MSKHWYNNGKEQKQYVEGEEPEGWVQGRIPLSEETIKKMKEKTKQTFIAKYGTDNPFILPEVQEKSRQTSLRKYGVDSPNKCKEVNERKRKTMLERYGVEHALQVEEFKEKASLSIQDRFGVEWATQSKEVQDKVKQTNLKRYGVENVSQSKEIRDRVYKTNLERYGVEHSWQSEEVKDKIKQTNLERYGVENPSQSDEIKDKKAQTCLKNYGVENPYKSEELLKKSQDTLYENYGVRVPIYSDVIRERMKKTCLERYGVEYAISSNTVRDKSKETMLERYGVEHSWQSEEVKEKVRQTCLERYGTDSASRLKEVQDRIKKTNLERYGYEYAFMDPKYRLESNYSKNDSKPNKKFAEVLDTYNVKYEREFYNKRYYYDFKVGNTLIEIDPYPTHNSLWGLFDKEHGLDENYHVNKSKAAEESGYRCIHIFDWDDQEKIIQNLLLPKERVYARNTKIFGIDKKEVREFLNEHHLQGTCNGQNVCLGLKDEFGELISLMTFGKPRYNKNYEWELLRYCSIRSVIGGAEKLFKHFIKTYNPESIISYCDRSKFRGDVYKKLGFKVKSEGRPSKHWYGTYDERHITDNLLRSRGFDQLFNESYGKGTSNEELIISKGYVPIYDCGQSSYIYKRKEGS